MPLFMYEPTWLWLKVPTETLNIVVIDTVGCDIEVYINEYNNMCYWVWIIQLLIFLIYVTRFCLLNSIFERFCSDIISRIQHNIECLTLDSLSIDRVLQISSYPKLFHMASNVFNQPSNKDTRFIYLDKSPFIRKFKHQITHLDVMIDCEIRLRERNGISTNIFTIIFFIFTNLIHLDDNRLFRRRNKNWNMKKNKSIIFILI